MNTVTTQQYLTADGKGILSVYTDLPFAVEIQVDKGEEYARFMLERSVVRKMWEQIQEWLEGEEE